MKKRIRLSSVLISLLFLAGLSLVAYPFVANELNNLIDDQLIKVYQNKATKQNEQELAKTTAKWEKENKQLLKEAGNQVVGADPFTETKQDTAKPKDYFESHTIAYLSIPKLKLKLPVFDSTNELLLEKGAGLLEGTSYPIGGLGTHSVLSAHRGLESAKLFTDLPKLVEGDQFLITIGKEKHAYEVDQITVIEPDDPELLRIVEGQDYLTLLTCTPFMVNSHRLLVRGHRIAYSEDLKKQVKKSEQDRNIGRWLLYLISFLVIVLLVWLIVKKQRNTTKHRWNGKP